ncbi:putative bifunctional diguanylate cyclase/phosphodiesterase [Methylocystis iwaonis]|uniref:putative bifunctional diguanylate cyclase/phosphodiesterase n=1 Tax=Methylocystis iwaonis TaxID=2885079 RepID=UPI002E7C3786|nr:EAL domain-containing protein [Methylocystis iwaonis]
MMFLSAFSGALSRLRAYFFDSDKSCLARLRHFLEGDPLAFEACPLSPSVRGRFRAEQLTDLERGTPVILLVSCFSALTFLLLMWETPVAGQVEVWTALVFCLAGIVYARRVSAPQRHRSAVSANGVWRATANAFLHGALWGVFPAFFFADSPLPQQLVIVGFVLSTLFGGGFALCMIPGALLAHVAPIWAGFAVALLSKHDPVFDVVGFATTLYSLVMINGAFKRAEAAAQRCAAEAAAQEGALRDELTLLPNRVAFREELARSFARLARKDERFALMCLDLDGFKNVNDSMGHEAGDLVLVEAARRLKASTRENDLVARLGGDEFALIAVDIRNVEDAVTIARRILASFRAPFEVEGRSLQISTSIGVAIAPSDGVDPESIMRSADSAMYATKQAGRCGYTLFRDRFGFIAERNTLGAELDRAFAEHELFMVYQPFVDSQSCETTGFEALLRWRHPVRGVLSAAEIVPLFEREGQIERVGSWALREATAAAQEWPSHLRLAVNVSALQLRKHDFEEIVREALNASGLEPGRLELELTETAMILDGEKAYDMLANLRQLGVKTALDDLGTGYSSLANLVGLPLDRLKIDRSFVANLETNPMCASVVKLTIELARSLSLSVTAEGVETARQLKMLSEFGCREVQGYLFSAPRPVRQIGDLFGGFPIVEEARAPTSQHEPGRLAAAG